MLVTTATKASRAEAFALIKSLLEHADTLVALGVCWRHELEATFLHLAPTPKKHWTTPEAWVATAASADDTRFGGALQFLHSDGRELFASDGRRVHWCSTSRPVGSYCPRTFERCEGARVEGARWTNVSSATPEVSGRSTVEVALVAPVGDFVRVDGRAFPAGQWAQAVAVFSSVHVLNPGAGVHDALLLGHEWGRAVIMPMCVPAPPTAGVGL